MSRLALQPWESRVDIIDGLIFKTTARDAVRIWGACEVCGEVVELTDGKVFCFVSAPQCGGCRHDPLLARRDRDAMQQREHDLGARDR